MLKNNTIIDINICNLVVFFIEESKDRKRKDIPNTANVTIKLENVGMRELYELYIGDIQSSVFEEDNEYHKMHHSFLVNSFVNTKKSTRED